jgi:hypothetical protein
MSTNRTPSSVERRAGTRKLTWLMVCVCVVWCGGCFTKKVSAYRIAPVTLAHPLVPAASSTAALEAPPDIPFEFAKLPPGLTSPHTAPARPRVAPAAPAEPAAVEQPTEPIIVPDLSQEELSAAKYEAQHSLDLAESNLAQTQGKKISSAQEDVASKIRGFMDSSREAMKNSDWLRAKNLAKKAEVLSRELAAKQ